MFFDELTSFIREYASVNNDVDVLDLMRCETKKHIGETITFQNYVGMIELKSGLQIEILPKIYGIKNDSDYKETKRIFINMLKAMRDFEGRSFNFANLDISKTNIYDLFIDMYLQEVNKLVKKGLRSNYVSDADNLNTIRGRIDIKENILKNYADHSKIYCIFDEYEINRIENRLIKSTLIKFSYMRTTSKNIKTALQMLNYFDGVEPSTNYVADFSKIQIDRNTKDYELLMRWSKVFLLNKSFTSFSGKTTSRVLLFKMDSLFEQFVAKLVKKFSNEKGYVATPQEKELHLFDSPSKFSLKPDIVVKKPTSLVIMDTKWKRLANDPSHNYGISQADMYQMYAYAKKYEKKNSNVTPDVYVLYPLNDEMKTYSDPAQNQIIFSSNDGVKVKIYFIDLEHYNESVCSLISSI